MFERIPHPLELAIFVLLALTCALVVVLMPKRDDGLFFASVPLFFVCSMMGYRRNQRRQQGQDDE